MHFVTKVSHFFQRNHQKVKLIDDCQFVGSFNVAEPYTGVRYGSASFRDLNICADKCNTKNARKFFRNMLLRNIVHHPDKLNETEINTQFDKFDKIYEEKDA